MRPGLHSITPHDTSSASHPHLLHVYLTLTKQNSTIGSVLTNLHKHDDRRLRAHNRHWRLLPPYCGWNLHAQDPFEVVVARMDTQTLHERTRTATDTNRHKRTQTTNAYGRKRKNQNNSLLTPSLSDASTDSMTQSSHS